ncbi:MAG: dipeptidase [Planctomycetota bacterium]|jgi:membrane dipeptidase
MPWLIVDGHEDIAMALLEGEGRDFSAPAPPGQALSLADAKRGGLGVILGTIFAPDGYWKDETTAQAAERQMRCYEDLLHRHEMDLFRVESRGDLSLCRSGGPIGLLHLMEGADPISSPRDMKRWADRGVRVVGLAWNTSNRYCGGMRDDTGLTEDGRRLLAEMRELRVVPDVSHLNERAVDDILGADDGLVVASHSNAQAMHPHRRNLSDRHIRDIAARDGLVGVVLYSPFLTDGECTLDHVVRHIEHMAGLVGPDHVGIGSDLDGGFSTGDAPREIETVADLQLIGEALSARGMSDEDVGKVLGENWMRILRQALPA